MPKTLEEIEIDLKAVTDHLTAIDAIHRAAKLGRNMGLVFQCGHSGLYFPSDYVREWGRSYGIGLGPSVSSEVLDSDYHTAPPEITSEIRSFDQIMHPVGNCCAQVDMDVADLDIIQAEGLWAIPEKDDPRMVRRAQIVRKKQVDNPKGRLKLLAMEWQRLNPLVLVERR